MLSPEKMKFPRSGLKLLLPPPPSVFDPKTVEAKIIAALGPPVKFPAIVNVAAGSVETVGAVVF